MRYPRNVQCLVADPPWPFNDRLPGPSKRGAVKNYSLLSIDDIAAFPMPDFADDAILFLWRPAAFQGPAIAVARLWGFDEKTELVWYKRTKTGKPWFGMGRTLRAAHETCIVATRGKFKPLTHSLRSVLEAKVPYDDHGKMVHSAKPDAFYELVKAIVPAPRVELFARKRRRGFYAFGDEL